MNSDEELIKKFKSDLDDYFHCNLALGGYLLTLLKSSLKDRDTKRDQQIAFAAQLKEARYVENYYDGEYFHADEWQKRIETLKQAQEKSDHE